MKPKPNFRPLDLLDTSAKTFKDSFHAYAISTKILCSGPHLYYLGLGKVVLDCMMGQ